MTQLPKLENAMRAIDEAADAKCDAIKLGIPTQLALPLGWSAKVFQHAEERGISLLARPVDELEVTRLDWLGAHAYDIAFDVSDLELVATAARTGKPVFLSVGRATPIELEEIIGIARKNIALVVEINEHADLQRIERLQKYGVPIGACDSHDSPDLALEAIARGASIVEKRRGDRSLLAHTIRDCEMAWASLNDVRSWAHN